MGDLYKEDNVNILNKPNREYVSLRKEMDLYKLISVKEIVSEEPTSTNEMMLDIGSLIGYNSSYNTGIVARGLIDPVVSSRAYEEKDIKTNTCLVLDIFNDDVMLRNRNHNEKLVNVIEKIFMTKDDIKCVIVRDLDLDNQKLVDMVVFTLFLCKKYGYKYILDISTCRCCYIKRLITTLSFYGSAKDLFISGLVITDEWIKELLRYKECSDWMEGLSELRVVVLRNNEKCYGVLNKISVNVLTVIDKCFRRYDLIDLRYIKDISFKKIVVSLDLVENISSNKILETIRDYVNDNKIALIVNINLNLDEYPETRIKENRIKTYDIFKDLSNNILCFIVTGKIQNIIKLKGENTYNIICYNHSKKFYTFILDYNKKIIIVSESEEKLKLDCCIVDTKLFKCISMRDFKTLNYGYII